MREKVWTLKNNHSLFGRKGRLMSDNMYQDLCDDHKKLFAGTEQEPDIPDYGFKKMSSGGITLPRPTTLRGTAPPKKRYYTDTFSPDEAQKMRDRYKAIEAAVTIDEIKEAIGKF